MFTGIVEELGHLISRHDDRFRIGARTVLDGARIGDSTAWVGRAKDGFDSLVRSTIQGHGGMPARGGMASLTDAEMRDAVTYMFQSSVKNPK